MIKSIKKLLYKIFLLLKFNSNYYKLKNIINKINNKKIVKIYFSLFLKKTKENKKHINNRNKKGKKIVFNNMTKRYELINI